ncbi:MAG TPA: hypothetical protein VFR86_17645 [Burkholderiaceae bacterium]|nr:hypothetical protein [Burkholderiaceae bacterium]
MKLPSPPAKEPTDHGSRIADHGSDQAATLRRLFRTPAPRVLPVIITDHISFARWFAPLAGAFARAGERTLVLDGARMQTAAAFGHRARFELAHVLAGDCAPAQALIAAAPRLVVVPAARAFNAAGAGTRLDDLLRAFAPSVAPRAAPDLLLLALVPAQAHLLAGLGACALLPLPPDLAALRGAINAARSARESGDMRGFRLLFPGMPAASAASLFDRLAVPVRRRVGAVLQYAGPLGTSADVAQLARAAAGWELARLRWPELETVS